MRVNHKREFIVWGCLAAAALVLLIAVLAWQQRTVGRRGTTYVQPNPLEGGAVFVDKGCANCHGTDGNGGSAPSLRGRESLSSLPQLVTALWNHAPRMQKAIDEQKMPYPELSYEETGQLVSYLYFSRYADASGDPARGRQVFEKKNCWRCHLLKPDESERAMELMPSVRVQATDFRSSTAVDNPIAWTQLMWNHAAQMQEAGNGMGLKWPNFEANELRDLVAFVRQETGNKDGAFSFPPSDPDEGWKIFQSKGCIRCHSLGTGTPEMGPSLGAGRTLPNSFSEFGAVMLNHFPKMQAAMSASGQPVPTFERHEMADLMGFIYSLHYVEPSGVASVGGSVFEWRGCAQCHGSTAQGSRRAPALRGTGKTYTATRLACDLWRHGSRMYQQGREENRPWPTIQENDIGNLLTFLNSPPPN